MQQCRHPRPAAADRRERRRLGRARVRDSSPSARKAVARRPRNLQRPKAVATLRWDSVPGADAYIVLRDGKAYHRSAADRRIAKAVDRRTAALITAHYCSGRTSAYWFLTGLIVAWCRAISDFSSAMMFGCFAARSYSSDGSLGK